MPKPRAKFDSTVSLDELETPRKAATPFEASRTPAPDRELPPATPFDADAERIGARSVPVPLAGLDQTIAIGAHPQTQAPPTTEDVETAMAESRNAADDALNDKRAEREARKKARAERRNLRD